MAYPNSDGLKKGKFGMYPIFGTSTYKQQVHMYLISLMVPVPVQVPEAETLKSIRIIIWLVVYLPL